MMTIACSKLEGAEAYAKSYAEILYGRKSPVENEDFFLGLLRAGKCIPKKGFAYACHEIVSRITSSRHNTEHVIAKYDAGLYAVLEEQWLGYNEAFVAACTDEAAA